MYETVIYINKLTASLNQNCAKKMKILITSLFVLIFTSHKPKKIFGSYEIIYDKEFSARTNKDYLLNFNDNQYSKKLNSGNYAKGKFKIIEINTTKKIILLDNRIFKSKHNPEKFEVEDLGKTRFEITEKNKDTLIFRETNSNKTEKIISEGIFVKY